MKHLRIDRSRAILPLLALVTSTSSLFAAGIVVKVGTTDVTTSGIAVSCNLQTSSSANLVSTNHPVTVTLSASPASTITIGTSLNGSSPIVAAPAAGTTLAATTTGGAIAYSTGITFNINAQPYCANITATGTSTATFNFTGTGGLTSGTITVTFTVPAIAYTTTVTPSSSFTYNCSTSSATPTAQLLTAVLSAAPITGSSVVYSATAYTNAGASVQAAGSPLVVTVPSTAQTPSSWAGVSVSVNAQPYCAVAAGVGSTTQTFNLTGTVSGAPTGVTVTDKVITVTFVVAGSALTSTVTPSASLTFACNSGSATPTAQLINVALAAAPPVGASIVYTATAYTKAGGSVQASASPLLVSVPSTPQTSSSWSGVSVSVNAQPYCANASSGTTTQTFSLTGTVTGGPSGITVTDKVITVAFTVTPGVSPLTVSPSAISINCTHTGSGTTASDYSLGQAQLVSLTGPTAANLVFSVNTSTSVSTALAWATLNPAAGSVTGTAGTTPYNFTIAPNSNCGAFTTGSHSGTIHLTNGQNLDKIINVTLNMVAATPLQSSLSAPALTYVRGSGTPGYLDVAITNITPGAPYYFTVDTSSLPTWLTVDATSGLTPRSLRFSSTSIADTMAPGSYSQKIRIQSANYGDLLVNIPMRVSNPQSTLSVSGAATPGCTVTNATQSCSWTIGQPLPTLYITLKSSDSPIAYSIVSGGTLAPIVPKAEIAGLAYSFGTTIPVTFSQSAFTGVAPGTMVSGTVSITSGSPATTYVVTFNITAQAPGAILTGVSPMIVPTLAPGQQVQVVLIGSGFVKSTDITQATTVGIVNQAGAFVTDTNFSVNVLNASNILLTITVPNTADALLDFATATTFGVTIGVCNPAGATCTVPTGKTTLTIGAKPIIQTITSASSYVQASSNPPVAPYDMISIFGTNLCSSCVGTNSIMYGSPQSSTLAYPTSLSNTDGASITRTLQVSFQQHAPDGPTFTTVTAPLLFATNNQINLLVPSTVSTAISGNNLIDIVVSFGTGASTVSSNPFPVTAVATNPGIFTIAASGQGNGAILDKNYFVVGQSNPVVMHSGATSDPVMIYMTGMGAPSTVADNTTASATNGGNGFKWSDDCIAPSGYTDALGALTGVALSTVDGLILQSSLLNTGRFVPCLDKVDQLPVVKIGGVAAVSIDYAGWVADSIAGLYQVNATLPSTTGTFYTSVGDDCSTYSGSITNITQPTQLPVCVKTKDDKYSQTGVMVWVAPRLVVAAPPDIAGTPAVLTEKVGAAAATGAGHAVVATEGSGAGYTYAITSGVLPSGLSLTTGGQITGTPAMGTMGDYPVTVTATDTSTPPITGTVSFTVHVGTGLFMASSIVVNGNVTPGTGGTGSIVASGGSGGYVYSIDSGTLPNGLLWHADGSITGTPTATSAATVVFKAVDSTGVTGYITVVFNITAT